MYPYPDLDHWTLSRLLESLHRQNTNRADEAEHREKSRQLQTLLRDHSAMPKYFGEVDRVVHVTAPASERHFLLFAHGFALGYRAGILQAEAEQQKKEH